MNAQEILSKVDHTLLKQTATWEDIKEICIQSVLVEIDLGGLVSDERHYTEVLKRFKERKEK
jgi:deoxyribose-phosphate aldolase